MKDEARERSELKRLELLDLIIKGIFVFEIETKAGEEGEISRSRRNAARVS